MESQSDTLQNQIDYQAYDMIENMCDELSRIRKMHRIPQIIDETKDAIEEIPYQEISEEDQ